MEDEEAEEKEEEKDHDLRFFTPMAWKVEGGEAGGNEGTDE